MKTESIEKYQEILRKDPQSRAFAALAEAYRERGQLKQAEQIALEGTRRHPSYVSGFVALGKVLVTQERWKEAETVLQKAATLGPENILAHQLLGQIYLRTKRPKDALKAYKLVLFLNPQSEMAKKAVEKLESLTADEFDDDIFEMKKLPQIPGEKETPKAPGLGSSRDRTLSLIDAFIVRNDLAKARDLLRSASADFPGDADIQERWEMLSEEVLEEAVPIQPDNSRENFIRERKLRRLDFVLQRIKNIQASAKN
jgi:tetratricopeptide (TPR) repeat protein